MDFTKQQILDWATERNLQVEVNDANYNEMTDVYTPAMMGIELNNKTWAWFYGFSDGTYGYDHHYFCATGAKQSRRTWVMKEFLGLFD